MNTCSNSAYICGHNQRHKKIDGMAQTENMEFGKDVNALESGLV